MKSQKFRLLEWLKKRGSVTRIQAYEKLGIFELSRRLSELQADGHIIDRGLRVYVKNRFGENIRVSKAFLIKAKY
jgi:hypothetical protein